MDLHAIENGGGLSEIDFQRLAQTIATSIQKVLQNGKTTTLYNTKLN